MARLPVRPTGFEGADVFPFRDSRNIAHVISRFWVAELSIHPSAAHNWASRDERPRVVWVDWRDVVLPEEHLFEALTGAVLQIDFPALVMNVMLGLLLLAGALQVDFPRLRGRALTVGITALLGTSISTVVVGMGFFAVAKLMGAPITLAWSFVFGAIISPTDPIAVLSTLKNVKVPEDLEVEMQGEALFNDGIGIVLFTALLRFAIGDGDTGPVVASRELLIEAGGGIGLGLLTGYVAYRAMSAIDYYAVEVLITLALATGTYALA